MWSGTRKRFSRLGETAGHDRSPLPHQRSPSNALRDNPRKHQHDNLTHAYALVRYPKTPLLHPFQTLETRLPQCVRHAAAPLPCTRNATNRHKQLSKPLAVRLSSAQYASTQQTWITTDMRPQSNSSSSTMRNSTRTAQTWRHSTYVPTQDNKGLEAYTRSHSATTRCSHLRHKAHSELRLL